MAICLTDFMGLATINMYYSGYELTVRTSHFAKQSFYFRKKCETNYAKKRKSAKLEVQFFFSDSFIYKRHINNEKHSLNIPQKMRYENVCPHFLYNKVFISVVALLTYSNCVLFRAWRLSCLVSFVHP